MEFTGERLINASSSSRDLYLQHVGRYLFAKPLVDGKTVLDVACGAGYGSQILSHLAKRVVGADIDRQAIEHCRSRYSGTNLSFVQMDGCHLAFSPSSFDAVVSFETLEHLENPEVFLKELNRVLKVDGQLIISTPNKELFSLYTKNKKNPFHYREFTQSKFEKKLRSDFFVEEILGQRFFAKKDVPLIAEISGKKIQYGNDHLLRRIVRVGLRRLFNENIRSNHFLSLEVWANKCKVGDAAPHRSVYLIALARKLQFIANGIH
jgi:ubiquinone/menaquinone biosynthesis C-methylase UbiE